MDNSILLAARNALNSPLGNKYGAVIVYNNKIIGVGYNSIPYGIPHRILKQSCLL
jgi:deoxycytidylate deaminase